MVELPDIPTRVVVAAGERVSIDLPSYAGSGNLWTVTCRRGPDRATVAVVRSASTAAHPGTGVEMPPTPVLAAETAEVTGVRPGDATWELVLARPWAPTPPAAVHRLDVVVT